MMRMRCIVGFTISLPDKFQFKKTNSIFIVLKTGYIFSLCRMNITLFADLLVLYLLGLKSMKTSVSKKTSTVVFQA